MPLAHEDQYLKHNIPLQKLPDKTIKASELFIKITNAATEVLEFMAGSSLAINLLFGISMSKLWAMINGLQVINHYPLFYLVAPNNLGIVQAAFRKITSFDFETEDFFK
jgi:hypothetical protein